MELSSNIIEIINNKEFMHISILNTLNFYSNIENLTNK